MNVSIYLSTLCLVVAACMFKDTGALTIDGYASSSDCSSSSAPITGSFSVNPTGPNSVWLSANANIDEELDSPLKAVVKVKRKVLWWWITMPCVNDYGSCTYQDVCQFLDPSTCPLQSTTYAVETEIDIPSTGLPSWLTGGDYRVKIQLYKNNREVGCNEIYFNV